MNKKQSERRMAENEVVFRQHNEAVQQGFDEIKKIAKEDRQEHLLDKLSMSLYFYCECSDENCNKRIYIQPSLYNKIHVKRDQFVVLQGHEASHIEEVISKEQGFYVVKKHITPPAVVPRLQPTDINNV